MSWIYRKPEPTDVRGVCILCNARKQKKTSSGTYQALCRRCERIRWNMKNRDKRKYIKYKGELCSRCGFIPEHRCQLDVHHVDGNHHNNDPNNLVTLCANCHRLQHKDKRIAP